MITKGASADGGTDTNPPPVVKQRKRIRRSYMQLDRNVKCEYCDRNYATEHSMLQHIRLKHRAPNAPLRTASSAVLLPKGKAPSLRVMSNPLIARRGEAQYNMEHNIRIRLPDTERSSNHPTPHRPGQVYMYPTQSDSLRMLSQSYSLDGVGCNRQPRVYRHPASWDRLPHYEYDPRPPNSAHANRFQEGESIPWQSIANSINRRSVDNYYTKNSMLPSNRVTDPYDRHAVGDPRLFGNPTRSLGYDPYRPTLDSRNQPAPSVGPIQLSTQQYKQQQYQQAAHGIYKPGVSRVSPGDSAHINSDGMASTSKLTSHDTLSSISEDNPVPSMGTPDTVGHVGSGSFEADFALAELDRILSTFCGNLELDDTKSNPTLLTKVTDKSAITSQRSALSLDFAIGNGPNHGRTQPTQTRLSTS